MVRGRKPKPAHVKKLEGNPGKRPIPEPIQVDAEMPTAPEWFSERELKNWNELAPLAYKMGTLDELSRALFVILCCQLSLIDRCDEALDENGETYEMPDGRKRLRPEVKIRGKAQREVTSLLSEFGFTPAGRARLGIIF
jgi:P27 family predicted phage terminase small subunit